MLSIRTNNYPVSKSNRAFYNLVDEFFNDSFFTPAFTNLTTAAGTFKIDVKERDQEFVVEAELPGVKKEDVELEYKDNRLIISVNANEEKNEENDGYIYKERRSQAMHRALFLKDVDASAITAKLDNGILTINAPKIVVEEDQYRIEIQ